MAAAEPSPAIPVPGEGVLWHTVSHPRVSPCWGIARPCDLFQKEGGWCPGASAKQTLFYSGVNIVHCLERRQPAPRLPFSFQWGCLSASKRLIKKATSLFKPFYFVWDGCLLLSLRSPPCRLRFRLRLAKTRLSLITYWGSRIPR